MNEFSAEVPNFGEGPLEDPEPREIPRTIAWEGGQEVIRIGDVDRAKQIYSEQGNNEYKFAGTCGLASIAGTLRMFGLSYSENDILQLAKSFHPQLCDIEYAADGSYLLDSSGGTSERQQLEIFKKVGIEAHEQDFGGPEGADMEDIAAAIEKGQGVVANVNAGTLWREEIGGAAGEQIFEKDHALSHGIRDHAIEIVGLARDATTDQITGFYVNDTGDVNPLTKQGDGAGRFISVDTMREALVGIDGEPAYGSIIVTDEARPPLVG
jgi:hypothetical protein